MENLTGGAPPVRYLLCVVPCKLYFGSFVIMELLKMVVPAIVPAVFSCYFDIFDGLIQAYVFVFLTGLFIKEATE